MKVIKNTIKEINNKKKSNSDEHDESKDNLILTNEPHNEKTNILHTRKQKTQISFSVTAKLIGTTGIVLFFYFLNPKIPASSYLLYLYSLVCVGPVWKPYCWFSHDAAQIFDAQKNRRIIKSL